LQQFSFLTPPPISWLPCKQKHSQRGAVAHTAGLGSRVDHGRQHWVSQDVYGVERLSAAGSDAQGNQGGSPREADPA